MRSFLFAVASLWLCAAQDRDPKLEPPKLEPPKLTVLEVEVQRRPELGQFKTVTPIDEKFFTGDEVRLFLKVNSDGFLRVLCAGSSGTWSQLYPQGAQTLGVQSGVPVLIPGAGTGSIIFKGSTGTNRLLIVFATAELTYEKARAAAEEVLTSSSLQSRDLRLEINDGGQPGGLPKLFASPIESVRDRPRPIVVHIPLTHVLRTE